VREEGQGGDEEQGEGVLVCVLHGALLVEICIQAATPIVSTGQPGGESIPRKPRADVACCRPADVCRRSRRRIPESPTITSLKEGSWFESGAAAEVGNLLPCPETLSIDLLYQSRCCWGKVGGSNSAGTRCSDHVPGLSPKEAATADLVNCKRGETGARPGFFNESQMDHSPYLLLPPSHSAPRE
jgi:hypothetical protein